MNAMEARIDIRELWSGDDEAQLFAFGKALATQELLGALFAVAGTPGPEADTDRRLLDEWSQRIAERATGRPPVVQAAVMAAELSDRLGFRGRKDPADAPGSGLVHEVFESRRGLPVLLSAIWIEVGRRAGLAIEGISLPRRFVVRIGGEHGVLVDPYDAGRILTATECRALAADLPSAAGQPSEDHLKPATLEEMVLRVLKSLVTAHASSGDMVGVYRVLTFVGALTPQAPIILLQRGAIAEQLGSWPLAEKLYRRVAKRFPGTEQAFLAARRLSEPPTPVLLN